MKKLLLFGLLLFAGFNLSAQQKVKSQFLLIIRFKSDFKPASDDVVKTNIKHWQDYMGNLAQSGTLVSGYRPTDQGLTISGTDKKVNPTPYVANNELVSSVMVINAVDMDAAKAIADKCPVFEFGGSVEVRAMLNTAGKQQ